MVVFTVDIMGPSINNLDSLVPIPFGCGESNMLLFVANMIAIEYLSVRSTIVSTEKALIIDLIISEHQSANGGFPCCSFEFHAKCISTRISLQKDRWIIQYVP